MQFIQITHVVLIAYNSYIYQQNSFKSGPLLGQTKTNTSLATLPSTPCPLHDAQRIYHTLDVYLILRHLSFKLSLPSQHTQCYMFTVSSITPE